MEWVVTGHRDLKELFEILFKNFKRCKILETMTWSKPNGLLVFCAQIWGLQQDYVSRTRIWPLLVPFLYNSKPRIIAYSDTDYD